MTLVAREIFGEQAIERTLNFTVPEMVKIRTDERKIVAHAHSASLPKRPKPSPRIVFLRFLLCRGTVHRLVSFGVLPRHPSLWLPFVRIWIGASVSMQTIWRCADPHAGGNEIPVDNHSTFGHGTVLGTRRGRMYAQCFHDNSVQQSNT